MILAFSKGKYKYIKTLPILFSLFLNDIKLHLQENINVVIDIDQIAVYLLLFADDTALISDTREGLQKSPDCLFEYCCKWKLAVNVEKTKIMVFKKGGRLSNNDRWFHNNHEDEIVS